MSSLYPDAFDNPKEDFLGGDQEVGVHAQHHNLLASIVKHIETELGINPSGTTATVAARLDVVLNTDGSFDLAVLQAALDELGYTPGGGPAVGTGFGVGAFGVGPFGTD